LIAAALKATFMYVAMWSALTVLWVLENADCGMMGFVLEMLMP
jgi:hypothetical protein